MSAAEDRHERQMRELGERRRKEVEVAVDQLAYDLGRSSTEAWALVDRLRSMNASLIARCDALERDLKTARALVRERDSFIVELQQERPAAPAKEGP